MGAGAFARDLSLTFLAARARTLSTVCGSNTSGSTDIASRETHEQHTARQCFTTTSGSGFILVPTIGCPLGRGAPRETPAESLQVFFAGASAGDMGLAHEMAAQLFDVDTLSCGTHAPFAASSLKRYLLYLLSYSKHGPCIDHKGYKNTRSVTPMW